MGKRALFRNIIGTNSEISQFWVKNWYLRSKCRVRIEVNTDNASKSRWHFGRSTGLAKCAKTCFCRSTSTTWWSYRATFLVLQPLQMFVHFFQWNESEHVVLPIVIIWHSVRWISGALNEHYLKFWALNRALNAEKTRDAQSTKSKFYEH